MGLSVVDVLIGTFVFDLPRGISCMNEVTMASQVSKISTTSISQNVLPVFQHFGEEKTFLEIGEVTSILGIHICDS